MPQLKNLIRRCSLCKYQAVSSCNVTITILLCCTVANVQDDEAIEVYYGTYYGMVGVADLQQSTTSYQVMMSCYN